MSQFWNDLMMQWQMQYIPLLALGLFLYTSAIIRRDWRMRKASFAHASLP